MHLVLGSQSKRGEARRAPTKQVLLNLDLFTNAINLPLEKLKIKTQKLTPFPMRQILSVVAASQPAKTNAHLYE